MAFLSFLKFPFLGDLRWAFNFDKVYIINFFYFIVTDFAFDLGNLFPTNITKIFSYVLF